MRTKLNIVRIIRSNPSVDRAQFEETAAQLRELAKAGVIGHGYDLASPFAQPQQNVPADDIDPRCVHLR